MVEDLTVAVAISGGVDSSLSALLLKRGLISYLPKGLRVIGITFVLFDGQRYLDRAKRVAQFLEIEHYLIDLREVFKEKIINYFINSYGEGITPNPCALCNRLIKFGIIPEIVERNYGASYYATGHYVEKGRYKNKSLIKISANRSKDQSYFLALVREEILSKLIFPVGSFSSKEEVKKLALNYGLTFLNYEESQDICFFQGKTLKEYLKEFFGEQEGEIIYQDRVVGKHKGFFYYTIGQRRGLNLPFGKPLYITKIDPKENRVYLGEKEALFRDFLYLEDINFHLPLRDWGKVSAQIRYRSEKVPVKDILPEGDRWKIIFEREIRGVTPGQVCAFYENHFLLGGGIISKDI